MATRNERQILEIIEEKGGETSVFYIAGQMGFTTDYTRIVLESLGRRDFIDVLALGKVRMRAKGWAVLGKSPSNPYWRPGSVEGTNPESPHEKYQRWVVGKKREESKAESKAESKEGREPLPIKR